MIHRASFTGALWNSAGWVISQLRLKIEFSDGNVNAWTSHGHGLWISTNIIVFIGFVSFTILYPSLLDSCQGLRPHTQVGFCETQVTHARSAPFSDKHELKSGWIKTYAYATMGWWTSIFQLYTFYVPSSESSKQGPVTSTIGQIIINRWSLNIMNTQNQHKSTNTQDQQSDIKHNIS